MDAIILLGIMQNLNTNTIATLSLHLDRMGSIRAIPILLHLVLEIVMVRKDL